MGHTAILCKNQISAFITIGLIFNAFTLLPYVVGCTTSSWVRSTDQTVTMGLWKVCNQLGLGQATCNNIRKSVVSELTETGDWIAASQFIASINLLVLLSNLLLLIGYCFTEKLHHPLSIFTASLLAFLSGLCSTLLCVIFVYNASNLIPLQYRMTSTTGYSCVLVATMIPFHLMISVFLFYEFTNFNLKAKKLPQLRDRSVRPAPSDDQPLDVRSGADSKDVERTGMRNPSPAPMQTSGSPEPSRTFGTSGESDIFGPFDTLDEPGTSGMFGTSGVSVTTCTFGTSDAPGTSGVYWTSGTFGTPGTPATSGTLTQGDASPASKNGPPRLQDLLSVGSGASGNATVMGDSNNNGGGLGSSGGFGRSGNVGTINDEHQHQRQHQHQHRFSLLGNLPALPSYGTLQNLTCHSAFARSTKGHKGHKGRIGHKDLDSPECLGSPKDLDGPKCLGSPRYLKSADGADCTGRRSENDENISSQQHFHSHHATDEGQLAAGTSESSRSGMPGKTLNLRKPSNTSLKSPPLPSAAAATADVAATAPVSHVAGESIRDDDTSKTALYREICQGKENFVKKIRPNSTRVEPDFHNWQLASLPEERSNA